MPKIIPPNLSKLSNSDPSMRALNVDQSQPKDWILFHNLGSQILKKIWNKKLNTLTVGVSHFKTSEIDEI